jgi:predicted molibdopterin-dependent oxidoreductase YjgC
MGRMTPEELERFYPDSGDPQRITSPGSEGLTVSQAIEEAGRCMACDCAKPHACQLREFSTIWQAKQDRLETTKRPTQRLHGHKDIVFEPGKCIKCGLCIQACEKANEPFGLTFRRRGFGVEIGMAMEQPITALSSKTALICAEICPTGAIALKKDHRKSDNDTVLPYSKENK